MTIGQWVLCILAIKCQIYFSTRVTNKCFQFSFVPFIWEKDSATNSFRITAPSSTYTRSPSKYLQTLRLVWDILWRQKPLAGSQGGTLTIYNYHQIFSILDPYLVGWQVAWREHRKCANKRSSQWNVFFVLTRNVKRKELSTMSCSAK